MCAPKFNYNIPEDPFVIDGTPEKICRKIKEYFNENGLSQNEIADALDVTPSAISNQLTNRPFGVHSAKRWSRIFGFSINWLTTGEGPMIDRYNPALTIKADNKSIMRHTKNHNDNEIPVIPAFLFRAQNIDVYKFAMNDVNIETLPKIEHLPDHDIFARCPGNAMSPKITCGSLVALKRFGLTDNIINGEIYAINTHSHGLIIRKVIDNLDGTIKCIPINQDQFVSINMYKFDIINIFKVVGYLTIN